MKKNGFLLVLFLCFVSGTTFADNYKIELTAPQLANDSVYLANYFNGKVYVNDTIRLDKKGHGVFTRKKKLPEGVYLVYFSPKRYYDFLVEENQQVKIKIDTLTSFQGLEVKGPKQSEAFNDYIRYMSSKKKEQESLMARIEKLKSDSIAANKVQIQLDTLDAKVLSYQKGIMNKYAGKTLGILVKGSVPFQFPDSLSTGDLKDDKFLMKRYQYSKNHYWDNINLSDKRIWRFNYVSQKMDVYLNKLLIQSFDSIIPPVMSLIEKSTGDSTAFEIMVNNMLNYAAGSKLMGMDKLVVMLAEKYYLAGKIPSADSTLKANLTREVRLNKYNFVGSQANNLRLEDAKGNVSYLYQQQGQMTLLFFFEPSCGHCKETTPKLMDVYKKYKDKGFKVVAFYTQTDKKEWDEFMEKNHMEEWINAWDPNRESYYWYYYDTSTTPGVYLMDKNWKIIAKKIDMPTLDMILEHELK